MKWKVITVIIIAITILIGMPYLMKHKDNKEKDISKANIKLIGTEAEYGDVNNLSYYAETGGEYEENFMEGIENIVLIANEYILLENGMEDYGISSLPEYMLRYLNYYLGEDIYEMEVVENSYEDDPNYPMFMVNISYYHETDTVYKVKCIYKKQQQRYGFFCEEIENSKKENPSSL